LDTGTSLRDEIRLLEDGFIEHDITFRVARGSSLSAPTLSLNSGASHSCRKQAIALIDTHEGAARSSMSEMAT
jgi:hypothetical protein